jgi:hypothetical protein
MNVNRVVVGGDRDHIVVALRAIFEKQHERLAGRKVSAHGRERAIEAPRDPRAFLDCANQSDIRDAASPPVDQWLELLDVGVPFAPEAEQHSGRSTATQSFGLGKVWDVQRGPAGRRSSSGDIGEDQREKQWREQQRGTERAAMFSPPRE